MVFPVAHEDVAVGHDGHPFQALELGITGAPGTERAQEASVRVEDLDAVVAGIGHADVALIVDRDASEREERRDEVRGEKLVSYSFVVLIGFVDKKRQAAQVLLLSNVHPRHGRK